MSTITTIIDKVLIKAEKDKKLVHAIPNTDIKLHLQGNRFREYDEDVITQDGIVVVVPQKYRYVDENRKERISTNIEIAEGDHVYCHHFLTHEENDASILAEGTYAMDYVEIYCKVVDGKIQTIRTWNLLEPVQEEKIVTDSGLIVNTVQKNITGLGIMKYPSKGMIEEGITEGHKVEFKRNAGYVILVEGKKYYRIEDKHIELSYGKE